MKVNQQFISFLQQKFSAIKKVLFHVVIDVDIEGIRDSIDAKN